MSDNDTESKEKKTRKQSPETVLKQRMRGIEKEMVSIDKVVQKFNEMKKEADGAEAKKVKLNNELTEVKAKLRKALGLD